MRRLVVLSVLLITVELLCYLRAAFAVSLTFDANERDQDLQGVYFEEMDQCNELKYKKKFDFAGMGIAAVKSQFLIDRDVVAINLANNKISYIPADAFEGVPNLLCLNLANNPLNWTKSMDLLQKSLVTLNLSGSAYNYESTFLSQGIYPNVKYLELSNNNIKALPESFAKSFPHLTYLYLKRNNIRSLRGVYDRLPNTVKVLHLENNRINVNAFYTTLYCRRGLTVLFLDGNSLSGNTISFSDCEEMQVLSLRDCSVARFSDSGRGIPNLVSLDLSSNNLWQSSFSFSEITTLKSLVLERNSLDSFNATLVVPDTLQHLSLSYNKIARVNSADFANLRNLRRLALRGNVIEEIHVDAFSKLTELEEIDLANNRLTVLPAGWSMSLRNLRYLNVNSNFFHFVEDLAIEAFLPLKHLFVKNNNITLINSEALAKLPAAVTVHVI